MTPNLLCFGNICCCEESLNFLVSYEIIVTCRETREEKDKLLMGPWRHLWNWSTEKPLRFYNESQGLHILVKWSVQWTSLHTEKEKISFPSAGKLACHCHTLYRLHFWILAGKAVMMWCWLNTVDKFAVLKAWIWETQITSLPQNNTGERGWKTIALHQQFLISRCFRYCD